MHAPEANHREAAARAPLYSILLPTHNRADVLPFALRSVFAQTETNFELLIVGDGCTDHTAHVVAQFADDARVRWFDLPKGPGFGYANRNVALREARGRYIAFMAHDDLWLPDHLELLAATLAAEENLEIVYSRTLWVVPRGLCVPAAFNLQHPETLELFSQKKGNSIPASCFVYRRECLDQYGYWNEQIPASGDWEMWARFIEGGSRRNFAYLPQPTCLHFRANWRTAANAGPPHLLRVWTALHEQEDYLPAALKLHVPENMSEQEAAWNALAFDPRGWTRSLRAAVVEALDTRVAHSDQLLLTLLRAQEAAQRDGAPAANFIDPTRQLEILERVAGQLEYQQASLVWKIVRRLNRLQTRVLPPDTRRQKIWRSVAQRARKLV